MKQTYDFSQMDFSRIAVIGCAGSGKTTLSLAIGNLLNKQVTHLDKILWGENWTELSYDEQLQKLTPVVERENWIIDGTWSKTLNLRYQRATLVIFLDYKPSLCAWRAFWRSVKNSGKQRDDLALGCVEKVNFPFYKYILNFNKNTRGKIEQAQRENATVPITILKSPKQTKRFVKQLQQYVDGK